MEADNQRVWVALGMSDELHGVYDSRETAALMADPTRIVRIHEYPVMDAASAKKEQERIVQDQIARGVSLCKHIDLPSPFCESLPNQLLRGAEVRKKWDQYCHEMDACNREIESILKESSVPHFVSVKQVLVENQEERLASPAPMATDA